MKTNDDGGPAFPVPPDSFGPGGETARPFYGMSLRDWFAGMALQGMVLPSDYSSGHCNNAAAIRAYHIADSMLQARKPKDQP